MPSKPIFYKTLEEAERHPKETFSPQNISKIVGMDPYHITLLARQSDETRARLGFPVIVGETRTRIPKAGFLKFMKGETS